MLPGSRMKTVRLRTPFFNVGPVNCYVYPDDPVTLFDCGPRTTQAIEDLEAGLGALGLRIEDVELLILSHQHVDHAGLAASIAERSGCVVAGHPLLAPYMADFEGSIVLEREYQREVMSIHGVPADVIDAVDQLTDAVATYGESVAVDRSLADDEELTIGSNVFRARLCPGHSPTDVLLVDTEGAAALAGDHLLSEDVPGPSLHRPLDRPAAVRRQGDDLRVYLDSLRRTAGLELEVVHPGHGEALGRPQALIHERLREQQTWQERVAAALSEGEPKTAYELACTFYGDAALRQPFETVSSIVGVLGILEDERRARAHQSTETIRYSGA
jgi:glyoxylase-like metal-dependent hydrolase (beta-lactamase superfamily II)